MNIDMNETLNNAERCDVSARRETLYQTIPRWRELLAAVRAGEQEFIDSLERMGLLENYGKATSSVHDYADIEGHAFILGIVSEDRWDEVQTKSYLTYASHWIDDFFDCPELVADSLQLMNDRYDIGRAMANMGPAGQVGFAMANRTPHPEAVLKALHRMLYGGLVQRSADPEVRRMLTREYFSAATRFVDPTLVREILTLQPEAYWATNKTVLELLGAAEREVDYTTAERWNLVYAPALFYQDADEEASRGELSFEASETPRLAEMVRMIRLGGNYVRHIYGMQSPQMRQLRFLALSFQNQPDAVIREYRAIWEGDLEASQEPPTES